MKIARLPLLEALGTIKPALATKPLIEELVHAWFDGKHIMAYNDAEMGVQVPLAMPFTGGMNGALLIGLLSASRAKELEINEIEDGMNLKAGRLKADLSLLPLERMEAVWQFPSIDKKNSFTISDDMLEAMKFVLVAVGKDTSIPETLGITFYFGKTISLYTTNSKTIARAVIDRPADMAKSIKGRIIMPTAFCEHILRVCGDGKVIMDVRDDCIIAKNEEGVMVYARIIDSQNEQPFPELVEKHMGYPSDAAFDIPEQLAYSLDQVDVILSTSDDPGAKMKVKIAEGKMRMVASLEGKTHKATTSIPISDDVPEVIFRVQPDLIRKGLGITDTMACTEEAIIMERKGSEFTYFISTESV